MFNLIFDTHGGLCNQMYDIQAAINYCLAYNIPFSFRYASLRNPHNLHQWYDVPFEELFDTSVFTQFSLYKHYSTLKCSAQNTHHFNNPVRAIEWIDINRATLPQLEHVQKQFIVLRQFWSIPCNVAEQCNMFSSIAPCKKIRKIFKELVDNKLPSKYNLIHYRYEEDFNTHFQIDNPLKLHDILRHITFKQNDLPIYIAANNVLSIPAELLSPPVNELKNVIYKTGAHTDNLNYEEAAFVDFMIGKRAQQVYGHHNSSFSFLLNSSHCTHYYYDLEMEK